MIELDLVLGSLLSLADVYVCRNIFHAFRIQVHGKLVPVAGCLSVTGALLQEKRDWTIWVKEMEPCLVKYFLMKMVFRRPFPHAQKKGEI